MKRKYEGLVTFCKINAGLSLVVGLIISVFNVASEGASIEKYVLIGLGVGLVSGAFWSFVIGGVLELLSDIECHLRKQEPLSSVASAMNPSPYSDNPYNRPHALNVIESEHGKK
jgi:hypothetical protein